MKRMNYLNSDKARNRPRSSRRFNFYDRASPQRDSPPPGAKLRIDNLHYDLTEDDLEGLFAQIGPVQAISIRYDRAGRSSGTAFVTYESVSSAKTAIRNFDGANANGQPIRLTLVPTAPSSSSAAPAGRPPRNPFDTAQRPSRSLFDRISGPVPAIERARSASPDRPRPSDVSRPPPEGIDRYVPGQRTRSPLRSNRQAGGRGGGGGRRRGDGRGRDEGSSSRGGGGEDQARRGTGGGGGGGGGGGAIGRDGRPRKTQEELDAEMEDYWGKEGANATETSFEQPINGVAGDQQLDEDVMMIE
ncbi:MAG: hypothetical protein M1816_007999 [Peltula sp. TS41687]|nr:MAG: hypothetical protein M1816_007999 [Peltula sp. TS41687]